MEEQMIRHKIKMALSEITAPEELVERMSKRATAIVRGREAEELLSATPEAKGDPALLARAVVGRLMLTEDMPKGVDGNVLAASLEKNQRFRQMAQETNATLLAELKTGKLICRLGMKQPEPPKPTETSPQVQIEPPELHY